MGTVKIYIIKKGLCPCQATNTKYEIGLLLTFKNNMGDTNCPKLSKFQKAPTSTRWEYCLTSSCNKQTTRKYVPKHRKLKQRPKSRLLLNLFNQMLFSYLFFLLPGCLLFDYFILHRGWGFSGRVSDRRRMRLNMVDQDQIWMPRWDAILCRCGLTESTWRDISIFLLSWTPVNASTAFCQFLRSTTCLTVLIAYVSLLELIFWTFFSRSACKCSHLMRR